MKFFIFLLGLEFLAGCAHHHQDSDWEVSPAYGWMANSPESSAAIAAVATGIAISQERRNYQSRAITGQCLCKNDGKSNIEFPCSGNIVVTITDTKEKELSTAKLNRGEFAFQVQKKVPYRLRITSDQFQPSAPLNQSFFLGDDVIIHLSPKTK